MSNLVPFQDMENMAGAIVKSGFYGFKSVDQVMAIMLVAQAENKHPATVVQEYDIIQGRPALKSQAILARFQLAGGKVKWNEVSRTKCSGTFTHDAGGSLTVEWTIDMAKQAGLYRLGSGWEKYPEDMLRARVISRAVRSLYPACILGQYSVEEVQDFDPKGKEIDITPIPTVEVEQSVAALEQLTEIDSDLDAIMLPLYIPSSETPYAKYATNNEWMDAYVDLFSKIHKSNKYSQDEKGKKLDEYRDANIAVMNKIPVVERMEMTARISAIIKGE